MGLRGIPNYFPSLYGSFLQPFFPFQFIHSFTYVLTLMIEPVLPLKKKKQTVTFLRWIWLWHLFDCFVFPAHVFSSHFHFWKHGKHSISLCGWSCPSCSRWSHAGVCWCCGRLLGMQCFCLFGSIFLVSSQWAGLCGVPRGLGWGCILGEFWAGGRRWDHSQPVCASGSVSSDPRCTWGPVSVFKSSEGLNLIIEPLLPLKKMNSYIF